MVVIHPTNDTKTSFLSTIYRERKNITVLDETNNYRTIMETLSLSPKDEVIMMLGNGSTKGLIGTYDKWLISEKQVDILRDHICIGIWDCANEFALKHNLNGLFTGALVLDELYAKIRGIDIRGENIEERNRIFAADISYCMRHYSLDLIPDAMNRVKDYSSQLNDFNYSNIFFYGDKPKTLDF